MNCVWFWAWNTLTEEVCIEIYILWKFCSGLYQNHGKPWDLDRVPSRELVGGVLIPSCACNKRNGLQDDCRRSQCRGKPWCLSEPWPDCPPFTKIRKEWVDEDPLLWVALIVNLISDLSYKTLFLVVMAHFIPPGCVPTTPNQLSKAWKTWQIQGFRESISEKTAKMGSTHFQKFHTKRFLRRCALEVLCTRWTTVADIKWSPNTERYQQANVVIARTGDEAERTETTDKIYLALFNNAKMIYTERFWNFPSKSLILLVFG